MTPEFENLKTFIESEIAAAYPEFPITFRDSGDTLAIDMQSPWAHIEESPRVPLLSVQHVTPGAGYSVSEWGRPAKHYKSTVGVQNFLRTRLSSCGESWREQIAKAKAEQEHKAKERAALHELAEYLTARGIEATPRDNGAGFCLWVTTPRLDMRAEIRMPYRGEERLEMRFSLPYAYADMGTLKEIIPLM